MLELVGKLVFARRNQSRIKLVFFFPPFHRGFPAVAGERFDPEFTRGPRRAANKGDTPADSLDVASFLDGPAAAHVDFRAEVPYGPKTMALARVKRNLTGNFDKYFFDAHRVDNFGYLTSSFLYLG